MGTLFNIAHKTAFASFAYVRRNHVPLLRHLFNQRALIRITEQYAKITGKRFHCESLQGGPGWNVYINSDMSVSCSCNDSDASGHIGDLRKQTLKDIFHGETARNFRNSLSNGKLPIHQCIWCNGLRLVEKEKSSLFLDGFSLPSYGIGIENTVICNLHCSTCPREVVHSRSRKTLTSEDVEIISRQIAALGIKKIFYFNYGEPFLSKGIFNELSTIRKHNPGVWIATSTNGVPLEGQKKLEAALMFDHIYFSIFGSDQKSVLGLQCNGNFEKSFKNMSDLVTYRNSLNLKEPVIEWKYVVFNWNDKKPLIQNAIKMAKESGVDLLSFSPSVRPPTGISFRYPFSSYFRSVGRKDRISNFSDIFRTRIIDFRE